MDSRIAVYTALTDLRLHATHLRKSTIQKSIIDYCSSYTMTHYKIIFGETTVPVQKQLRQTHLITD